MRNKLHEGYQSVPNVTGAKKVVTNKFEDARWFFINNNLNYKNKSLLDIGCNTGYFLFEALEQRARYVVGYEGNDATYSLLSEYVEQVSNTKVKVFHQYFDFGNFNGETERFDVIHLLNVMHHVGRDFAFDDEYKELEGFKNFVLQKIDSLASIGKYMVLQLGFNRMGDINKPIFDNGTKQEQIEFLKNGLHNWEIFKIGIAEKVGEYIVYKELSEKNIKRDDSLGEFLNRPIFIMKKNDKHN